MYSFVESLRSALLSIAAHRLRSVLTTLGVIIGVASVIAVVALVQGLSQSIRKQFEGLGSNVQSIQAYTPFEDQLRGKFNRLTWSDFEQLRFRVDGIEHVTPHVMVGGRFAREVRSGRELATPFLVGTTRSFQHVQKTYTLYGRFLSETDEKSRRRVCVIGERVRKDLRLPEDPVGRFIELGGEWFKVVGLIEPRGELFGFDQDNFVIIPYQTALSLIGYESKPDLQIFFSVIELEQTEAIQERIRRLLRQLHNLKPHQPDDFKIQTAQQVVKTFGDVINMITLVLGGIVGISLLVGGIGIMNIMLVSVTERTREIGICKALGAQRRDIMMQFLIEATVLALFGGLIGIAIGYALGYLVAIFIPGSFGVSVPWWVIVLACGFSALVGIIFGVVPATKAANLDPIEALRYE